MTQPIDVVGDSVDAQTMSGANNGNPTLVDFWNGRAEFVVTTYDTRLPMGESDTILMDDGTLRSYVHASYQSLGVVDSCDDPVPFPGCVVTFTSTDNGNTFQPAADADDNITCLIPCATCPCDSKRDHIDQQQYPRVLRIASVHSSLPEQWVMVYEYRGSVFIRSSKNGLDWSSAGQLPQTGIWRNWLMPCRQHEEVGTHPFAAHEYDCLVGSPPGLSKGGLSEDGSIFVFVGTGQNPGSMSCYRGSPGSHYSLFQKCDTNPLFVGSPVYGIDVEPTSEANPFFDFRTISSADIQQVDGRYYMLYEGVRGPHEGDPGDTQFAVGLARSLGNKIDGPWETFPGNPILVDMPGNVGVGHADILNIDGETVLFTSLDGNQRSRLALRWK